jgi:hypothetical protein
MSSTVRGVFSGGTPDGGGNPVDTMDYITVATAGNATDFGNLVAVNRQGACVNSTTRGIIGGGTSQFGATNTLQYITIANTGNTTDFGDLTGTTISIIAVHSSTKAYYRSDNVVTMATAANATNSGYEIGAVSGDSGVMPGWIAANG